MTAEKTCPRFEEGMRIIGKRWTGLVIHQLLEGAQRFCTIEDNLPISGKLLSDRLRELESEGIVSRTVYPETPVRIVYGLTKKGESLAPAIRALEQWSVDWIELE